MGKYVGSASHSLTPLRARSAVISQNWPMVASTSFALASQVPAGLVSKMLGVHISVAVWWQRASGGNGDVRRRGRLRSTRARPID